MDHAGPWPGPGDPYRVLGVSAGASQRDIARAYRRAVQRAHPDARPRDRQAAARFQALTDAYDLLRDPARRADYDRRHRSSRPSGPPPRQPGRPQPRQPVPASRWRGSPFLLGPPPGQLIWAGPVHVEPPGTPPPASQHGRSAAAAEYGGPAVILGVRSGRIWGWPW
jgi:curved DNA-binding protein CbpA